MRVPGFCTECRKFTTINLPAIPLNHVIGVCDDCRDRKTTPAPKGEEPS